ncbi:hypothetical protein PR048_010580 [Dryococelus australis]|uniref:Uncharacterized protein n=1 Tax=Dryococelus australis TaxID=614101 RepID=A0ABQ9I351_9NEOP|nr:hypothetical protein PR048_010580 [Dryococelus australis]
MKGEINKGLKKCSLYREGAYNVGTSPTHSLRCSVVVAEHTEAKPPLIPRTTAAHASENGVAGQKSGGNLLQSSPQAASSCDVTLPPRCKNNVAVKKKHGICWPVYVQEGYIGHVQDGKFEETMNGPSLLQWDRPKPYPVAERCRSATLFSGGAPSTMSEINGRTSPSSMTFVPLAPTTQDNDHGLHWPISAALSPLGEGRPNANFYTQINRTSRFSAGATVAERLGRSPPTESNRVRSPAGPLPDFRMWESCRTMPLVSGFFSGISHFPRPCFAFRRCSVLILFQPDRLSRPLNVVGRLARSCSRPGSPSCPVLMEMTAASGQPGVNLAATAASTCRVQQASNRPRALYTGAPSENMGTIITGHFSLVIDCCGRSLADLLLSAKVLSPVGDQRTISSAVLCGDSLQCSGIPITGDLFQPTADDVLPRDAFAVITSDTVALDAPYTLAVVDTLAANSRGDLTICQLFSAWVHRQPPFKVSPSFVQFPAGVIIPNTAPSGGTICAVFYKLCNRCSVFWILPLSWTATRLCTLLDLSALTRFITMTSEIPHNNGGAGGIEERNDEGKQTCRGLTWKIELYLAGLQKSAKKPRTDYSRCATVECRLAACCPGRRHARPARNKVAEIRRGSDALGRSDQIGRRQRRQVIRTPRLPYPTCQGLYVQQQPAGQETANLSLLSSQTLFSGVAINKGHELALLKAYTYLQHELALLKAYTYLQHELDLLKAYTYLQHELALLKAYTYLQHELALLKAYTYLQHELALLKAYTYLQHELALLKAYTYLQHELALLKAYTYLQHELALLKAYTYIQHELALLKAYTYLQHELALLKAYTYLQHELALLKAYTYLQHELALLKAYTYLQHELALLKAYTYLQHELALLKAYTYLQHELALLKAYTYLQHELALLKAYTYLQHELALLKAYTYLQHELALLKAYTYLQHELALLKAYTYLQHELALLKAYTYLQHELALLKAYTYLQHELALLKAYTYLQHKLALLKAYTYLQHELALLKAYTYLQHELALLKAYTYLQHELALLKAYTYLQHELALLKAYTYIQHELALLKAYTYIQHELALLKAYTYIQHELALLKAYTYIQHELALLKAYTYLQHELALLKAYTYLQHELALLKAHTYLHLCEKKSCHNFCLEKAATASVDKPNHALKYAKKEREREKKKAGGIINLPGVLRQSGRPPDHRSIFFPIQKTLVPACAEPPPPPLLHSPVTLQS